MPIKQKILLFSTILTIVGIFAVTQAHAQTVINVPVSPTGIVSTYCGFGFSSYTADEIRFGVYPSGTLIANGSTFQLCSSLNGFDWETGRGSVYGDGAYWISFTDSGTTYVAPFNRLSGSWGSGALPSDQRSRFLTVLPANGTNTSATSTVLSTYIYNNDTDGYNAIEWNLTNTDCNISISTCTNSPLSIDLPITISGAETLSTTTALGNGHWVGTVRFVPLHSPIATTTSQVVIFSSGVCSDCGLITLNQAQGTSTATTTDISAGCSTTVIWIPIGAITCFLFQPSPAVVTSLVTLPQQVSGKFPFVYASQLGQIRNAVFTASSTATTSLTIPLWKIGAGATSTITLLSTTLISNVPYSGVIYNVLNFLLYIAMAEYVYYRVIKMHDVTTPS